jgi:hypothetical protein
MRHYWWHDSIAGTFYAVATNRDGKILSAWMYLEAGHEWAALDHFGPLRGAERRGELHKNAGGYTDELGPSLGARQ